VRLSRWLWPAVAGLAAFALGACGSAHNTVVVSNASAGLTIDTAPASKAVAQVTWGLYRDVQTVDPIFGFDYPENTVDAALCDSLFRQLPDGSRASGLAIGVSNPTPTTDVLTLRPRVKFWDGHTMTSADVVYSLQRAASTKVGGFYTSIFSRVKSITATGPEQVTITLTKPDFWLLGELSSLPGVVIEKAFAQKAGSKYGTIAVGGMCTGPYKIKSWTNGGGLVAVVNPNYWDPKVKPKAHEIIFKGYSTTAVETGLITGAIGISYLVDPTILSRLKSSKNLTVTRGPSYITDALIVSNLKGALGDVRVRQALSMAIDRKPYIDAAFKGDAQLPNALANPGTWGYSKSVFESAWNALPDYAKPDIARAKKLIQQAGATGKSLEIGFSNEIPQLQVEAAAVEQAAKAIGLKIKLKPYSAAEWINVFTDPKVRAGLDGFFVNSYPDYGAPEAQYQQFVLPTGSLNYSGWQNAQVSQLLDQSRGTADPTKRAQLVVDAQKIVMQQLPWIPMSAPNTDMITQSNLTGAPASFSYMYAPWAAVQIGAR
jgi:peptide/nickel transport system substrate-binding protein